MSNSLRLQTNIISLEAESGDVALQQAMTRLPSLFNEATTVFHKYVGAPLKALFCKRDFSWVVSKIQAMNYADLRTREIYVPPGLISGYLAYTEELDRCAAKAANVKSAVLDPFNGWLGAMIGSPEDLKSVSAKINIKDFGPDDLNDLVTSLGKNFTSAGRQDSVIPYGLAISRNADWTEVVQRVDTINSQFSEEKHKNVMDSMEQLRSRLDMILQRIQDNPEEYQMSPAALKALANVTYRAASSLEYYALIRYKVQELNVALRDTEARMKEWL